jgi:hypothetical protein
MQQQCLFQLAVHIAAPQDAPKYATTGLVQGFCGVGKSTVLEDPHDHTGNTLFFRAAAFGCVFHFGFLRVDFDAPRCEELPVNGAWKRPGMWPEKFVEPADPEETAALPRDFMRNLVFFESSGGIR